MKDYQVMPPLAAEEYNELKNDIAQRGVMVPIEYDEYGNVLDGHHRLQICVELGIKDFPKVIRAGMTEAEKRTHARKLNMARRQLNREQKQELIREQLRETPEQSDRQIAKALGVSDKTVGAQRHSLEAGAEIPHLDASIGTDGKQYPRRPVSVFNPSNREERAIRNPVVVERMADTGANVLTAEKQIHREEKAKRKAFTLNDEMPEGMLTLYNADIRDDLPIVENNSIDCIITDPPYSAEFIPLYGALSRLAARVLKPGGSMIVMCGQSYLPQVIAQLCTAMTYHWCLAYQTPGGQSPQLFHKRVNTFWKPLLWFTKGDYTGDYVGDVLKSPTNDNDKRFHDWGQSLSGMKDIVERFTNPNDIILDPFLGGGTTGAAVVSMGRRFVGADIEQTCIDVSTSRIKEAYQHG